MSATVPTCKRGHQLTPENVYVRPNGRRECRTCKRDREAAWAAAHPGARTEAVRRYRSDPEKRERDRERSRRWKREHLGQPGTPRERSCDHRFQWHPQSEDFGVCSICGHEATDDETAQAANA